MPQARDVLVVGGGIAGIAIAERLAREARRQGKLLRIMLVERERQLASGASGGLEGWLHTGMLYTKLENPRTLINCLNSLEDLVNWYARDPFFSRRERCNLTTPAGSPGKPVMVPRDDGWFEGSIEFIVETDASDPEWAASCSRISTRSAVAFSDPAWTHPTLGLC
ncbi:MAG: FAD-dependent oxidoreductase, partial [Phycisphaerales bacterium JB041]